MRTETLQRAFKTLSDPTRARILALLEEEELAVQELTEVLDMTQSRVSGHLKILRDRGLLADRRHGTYVFYHYRRPSSPEWAEVWALLERTLVDDEQVRADRERASAVVQMRAARARAFFERVGPEWDTLRSVFNDDALRARAMTRLLPRGLRIVEIGTGTGALAVELARRGVEVHAVDHSPAMLETLRAKVADQGLGRVECRQADAASLPFEDASMDGAIAHMVLRYLPRPGRALVEMARVVAAPGVVAVSDFVEHEGEWMRGELGVQWLGFSESTIAEWFGEAGLEDFSFEVYETASNSGRSLPATFIASGRRRSGEVPKGGRP